MTPTRTRAHPVHPSVISRRARARQRLYRSTGYALAILTVIALLATVGAVIAQDWTLTMLFTAWAGVNLGIFETSRRLWERVENDV